MTRTTDCASLRSWRIALVLLGLAALARLLAPFPAYATSEQEMRSLDEQVQEIKSDVLGIAAELSLLEERLLYPSNTQVSIFVSLPEGETLELDSVQLSIDGEPVARHVYTWKELEALRRGGVQRLYTGNVATGEHQLDVVVSGKLAGGRDFNGGRSLRFQKAVEPKLIDLSLTGSAGDSAVQLGSR